tara:strand:+ start:97112 stop:97744 length:633 start_codon:yes stop_codon:yes gene_type:complete
MNLIKSLKWRYATKVFDNNKIIDAVLVDKIKQGFNLSASSYGLQPVKLILLKNKKIQNELFSISMNQKQVLDASHIAIFCININIDSDYIEDYFKRIKKIRKTEESILSPYRKNLISIFSKMSQIDIESWATKQAYLAMGNLLAVCADLKVDTCPMEGFDSLAYDEYFNLNKKGLKSVLIMPMGYRSSQDILSKLEKVRKPISESIINIE